jgi:glutamyl-Q tRNA(Asp) synthetase
MSHPMSSEIVLRFAPSPNGRLHLGHALSALTGARWAQRLDGRFLLRIEDIDTARARDAFVAGIFEDLTWLGVAWEQPVLRQSEHFAVYGAAADRLRALGVLYPCFATRTEIAAAAVPGALDPEGAPLYPGLHKRMGEREVVLRLDRGEPCCWRIDMARALAFAAERLDGAALTFDEMAEDGSVRAIAADPGQWGDAVIVRKDTPASYHLAVVVDDARQGISHVTRGRDLFAATDLHRLLQVLLGLPGPVYAHHALITDEDGRKLSKSAGDTSLAALRAQGVTAAEARKQLGF